MAVTYENVTEVEEDDARNYTITALDNKGKKICKAENIQKV